MDLQKIKALIDLLAESPLDRLEVIEGEERVKLVKAKRRGGRGAVQRGEDRSAAPLPGERQERGEPFDETTNAVDTTRAATSARSATAATADTPQIVRAPMFGIVHLTPSPGEAPFVQVGDSVVEGQVLCTIEAMKMFNAIECDCRGTLYEVLVAPGSEVESGQPLFRIG
ncbi:acetyl-CoA carboxylase biotin carboxyl carrier protein subunit [Trinickia symbiotica]|uniref:Biotin carboxyl carrier protein of acetyl-CoA carboxylase n=1 Tax=Trinickia symbiotica TaxID=863227 RepID=A0A2T3XV69_9BURK|nr:biotin/lipoyl-containing protein [Trinickia symbiotica]PTB20416.1 acetyl-CoA carboxylase biotin carboxyl carrier protein subunit [Trinickia symbiotica]